MTERIVDPPVVEENMEQQIQPPCNPQPCPSHVIEARYIAIWRNYCQDQVVPRNIGFVFPKNCILKLFWEVLGEIDADDEDFSFESLSTLYRNHAERMVHTTDREQQVGYLQETNLKTRFPVLNNDEKFDFSQAKPESDGNYGRRFLEYHLNEMLSGQPMAPLHLGALLMNWLKFNQYKPTDNIVGGFLAKDLLSVVRVCITVNNFNVNCSSLDGEAQRRPTEAELRQEMARLYQKVNPEPTIIG